MASISLPALAVQPPQQQPGPLDTYAKALQLKSLQNQQALQGQQLQGAQLQNQMSAAELRSQQAIAKAYSDAGGDLDQAWQLAAKYGAMPKDVVSLRQAAIQTKTQNLDLIQKQGAKALNDASLMKQAHDTVSALPPEQRAAAYPQIIQQLTQAGVDTSKAPPQYPGDQAWDMMGLGINNHVQQMAELAKQVGIEKDIAATRASNANASKSEIEANALQQSGGLTPQQREAQYQQIVTKFKSGQQLTPQELSFAKGYEAANRKSTTSVDSMTGAVKTSTTGPSAFGGGDVSSGGTAPGVPNSSLVDQIGTGKMPLARLDYLATRNPELLQAVAIKYPEFDGAKIRAYIDTTKDYTSGKSSIVLNAGGTALKHLQELKGIVDESPMQVRIPGTDAYQKYENKLQTVATELARFYAGGTAPSIPEINEIKKTMGATIGSRDAAILTQAKSMGDKLDSMEQTWANAAPSKAYQAPMPGIDARAKAARAALDPDYAQRSQHPQDGNQQGGGEHPLDKFWKQ